MQCKPVPAVTAWPKAYCPTCKASRRTGMATCAACLLRVKSCRCVPPYARVQHGIGDALMRGAGRVL
eukprot:9280816-Alexandrium_andersonii.AAC.1